VHGWEELPKLAELFEFSDFATLQQGARKKKDIQSMSKESDIHAGDIEPSLSPASPPRTGATVIQSVSVMSESESILTKVRQPLSLTRCQTLLVIIPEQFVQ
jgi:hypothetical protein